MYVYGFLEWCLGNFLRAQPLEKFISSHSFTAAKKNRQLLCAQRVPMHSTLCFCIKAVLEVSLARSPGRMVLCNGDWFCRFTCNHALRCEKKLRIPAAEPRETAALCLKSSSCAGLRRKISCTGNEELYII
jgi:hypothetical protein